MDNCLFDSLPVELIHHVLSYFSAHEIFYTFINVSSYIDAILIAYSSYQINFKSIIKTHFDLVCQHIIPDQVIALTLSNDENTPGLVELFLSRFQINQFTRLQSLTLIEIGPDLWECIVTKLIELKHLRSFFFISSTRNDSWIPHLFGNAVTKLDRRLFDSYAPILPQLYRLRLCHGDFLKSVQFPHLRHLILDRSSVDIIKHICIVAPQLQSLNTSFSFDALTEDMIYPLTQLKQLVLRIQGTFVSMNNIERVMSNLPSLKHLELVADCNNDVVNGQRWEIKVKNLVTFKFEFNLSVQLESQDLDSFRTSFWVEEKRWFVAYVHKYLFSVPSFNLTETNENLKLPLYSTVPNNEIFYERINTLDLSEISDNVNHPFTHVHSLCLSRPIVLPTLEKIVNLSRVQRLILYVPMENFPVILLINEMPNLRQISIGYDVENFLKQANRKKIEKIQTLEIGDADINSNDYNIEQLCTVFPNIEHLRVNDRRSITEIRDFLDRFKHLSTASFLYTSWFVDEEENVQQRRLKIQSFLDQIRYFEKFDFTYRFDCSSVRIWIR